MIIMKEGYKDSEIGIIPAEWDVVELKNISKITMGQSPKSDTYNTDNIGIPLIQGNADCKNRKTIPRTYTTDLTKECFIGDIIMTVRAPVGAISKSLHNACIGRGVCAIKSKEGNEYIYHCLVNYEEKWDKLSQGSTFTAVSGNDIKNLRFPLPPLKEQEKIADILSTADDKIDAIAIAIQKAQILKIGLLKKLLSEGIGHSQFKDSDYRRMPENWKIDKLEHLVNIVSGQSPSKFDLTGTKYKFFKVNQLNFCEKYLTNSEYAFDVKIDNLLDSGTVIFPKRGASIFTNKVRILTHKSFIDTNLMGLVTKNTLDNIFLYYWLSEFKLSNIADTSSIPQINNKHINPLKIPLPTLKEQKQIAEILSTADKKIEILKEKKEKYKTLKKGLLQKLLRGEIRV